MPNKPGSDSQAVDVHVAGPVEAPARLLLRPADAAHLLSIGRSTVYELLDRGEIPSVVIGRSRRIRRSDLDAYVDHL